MKKHYTTTVEIELELTETEQEIIAITRTSAYGQYWESDELQTPYSLEDIITVHETLGSVLGHGKTDVNVFKPNDSECEEDVPRNGELAEPAETLYQSLSEILDEWM